MNINLTCVEYGNCVDVVIVEVVVEVVVLIVVIVVIEAVGKKTSTLSRDSYLVRKLAH